MRDAGTTIPPAVRRKFYDPSILLEEYFYYADIQREQERQGIDPEERAQIARSTSHLRKTESTVNPTAKDGEKSADEKMNGVAAVTGTKESIITDEDWENAARAYRNASWISM